MSDKPRPIKSKRYFIRVTEDGRPYNRVYCYEKVALRTAKDGDAVVEIFPTRRAPVAIKNRTI